MNEKYKNIINMQPPDPPDRPRMSVHDRAAQFAPFAALTGFDDAIEETARVTDERTCMNEDEINRIDLCLRALASHVDEKPSISITYFVSDDKKSGGRYVTEIRQLKKIDMTLGTLTFIDNSTLPLSDVVNIFPTDMIN